MESLAAPAPPPPIAPLPPPLNLPLARNAWLVNLFTLVTLGFTALLVAFLKMPNEADTYVLIGVAGSAYTVMQTWSLVQCSRALRQGTSFRSAYLALLISLLLLNACVLGTQFSSALSIHPVREAFYQAALPVLVPAISIAVLFALPCTHWIERLRPTLSRRARILLSTILAGTLLLVLLPVPLFIYLIQFVTLHDDRADPYIIVEMWKPIVRLTPESVGDVAFRWTEGTLLQDKILRTGRVSNSLLQKQIRYKGPLSEAFSALALKDPQAALEAGLALGRTPVQGSFGIREGLELVAMHCNKHLSDAEMELILDDPAYNNHFRDYLFVFFNQSLAPKSRKRIASKLLQGGDFDALQRTLMIFADSHTPEEVLQFWQDHLGEEIPHRASALSLIYYRAPAELRFEMLNSCLKSGSDAMKCATLGLVRPSVLPSTPEASDAIALKILELLEATEGQARSDALRANACQALLGLGGRTIARSRLTSEVFIRQVTQEVRANLDSVKNSASQGLPRE